MVFKKRAYITTRQKIYISGGGTIIALFGLLMALSFYGVSVTDFQGNPIPDKLCAGTADEPCVQEIKLCSANYAIAFSRNINVQLNDSSVTYNIKKNDTLNRWRYFSFKGKTLNAGECWYLKLYVEKRIDQSVKWGLDYQTGVLDPVFEGYKIDDIFVSLDRNMADLTSGYAEFTLKNPTTFDFIGIDLNKLNFDVLYNPIASQKLFIKKNVSQEVPNYVGKLVKQTCKIVDNKTALTTSYDCSYYVNEQNGTKIVWNLEWVLFDKETLLKETIYQFRIEATWNAKLGKVSREWVPYMIVSDTIYRQDKWAWWDSDWTYKRSFNFTETSGVDITEYTFNMTVNPQSWAMRGDCQDIRIVNITNSILVPYNFTGCNDTRMNISFKDSISASTKNEYEIYYGNPTASGGSTILDNIYWFYDNFNANTSANWTVETGTWQWTSGAGGVMNNTAGAARIRSNVLMPEFNYTFSLSYYTWYANDAFGEFSMHIRNGTSAATSQSAIAWLVTGGTTGGIFRWWWHEDSSKYTLNAGTANHTWYQASMAFTNINVNHNISFYHTKQTAAPHASVDVELYQNERYIGLGNGDDSEKLVQFDNITVKRWAASEPAMQGVGGEEEYSQELPIIINLEYPANETQNITANNIEFGFTPTFYGGTPINCSLWTNESGIWNLTKTDLITANETQQSSDSNMTLFWHLDEQDGIIAYSVAAGYINGTLEPTTMNESLWHLIGINGSFKANGSRSIVSPNTVKFVDNLYFGAIDLWIYYSNISSMMGRQSILEARGEGFTYFGLAKEANNTLSIYMHYNTPQIAYGKTILESQKWYHIGINFQIRDGGGASNASITINGVPEMSNSSWYISMHEPTALTIGHFWGSTYEEVYNSSQAYFDEVRISNYTRFDWGYQYYIPKIPNNNTLNNITHNFSEGNYTWGIGCWDDSIQNFSENRTLTIDTIGPSTPTNLTNNTIGLTWINVTWNASTDFSGIQKYLIFRNGTNIANTSALSYNVTGLTHSSFYCFNVSAMDGVGNIGANASALLNTIDITPPTAPSNLRNLTFSNAFINITWDAAIDDFGIQKYLIFRNGSNIANTTALSYNNTGLSEYTWYRYNVSAMDNYNNIGPNATLVVRTKDVTPPTAPTAFSSQRGLTNISLIWTASTDTGSGVAKYVIYRNGTNIVNVTYVNYTDTSCNVRTTYNYTLRAFDNDGNGGANSSIIINSTYTANIIVTLPPGTGKYILNATGQTGTFQPFNQTSSVPIFKVNYSGEIVPTMIYIRLNQTLDTCMQSYFMPNNSIFNISQSWNVSTTAWVPLIELANNSIQNMWSYVKYDNCTPGQTFTRRFIFGV